MVENRQLGGQKNHTFAKPEGKVSDVLKRLWKYLRVYKPLFAAALVLSVVGNIFALMGPRLSGLAIDAIEPGKGKVDFETVIRCAVIMAILYLLSAATTYTLSLVMIRISRRTVYKMRSDVFDKLSRLPVGFFDSNKTGNIISIVSYDIDTINASLSNDLVQLAANAVTVIGSLIMLISISPVLVLVFAVTIPLSVLFTKYRSKRVRPLFSKRSAQLGALNGYIEEMISGQKTIKAYGREEQILEHFDDKNDAAVDAYYKADSFSCVTGPTVSFFNNLSLALISVFGAALYLTGRLSLGSLSSFVLYSRKFSGPINEFANIISDLQSSLAAAQRVFRLLDIPEETPDAENARTLAVDSGAVSFSNVYFGYTPEREVLHDFSLTAQAGKTVAVVGPTGAGKTTIINLLMRFYDADSGKIEVDGNDITLVTRDSLRRSFTMVLQETWLFSGTIFDNIAYGKDGVTREQVEAAAKAARIHKFIMSLPDGYDTVLSDNAVSISKGQKQLLTIARAMLLDSEILILDEATSSVDTQTERNIQSAMLELMNNRTCFVIAHRLSTIKNADLIILLKDGLIAEQGTHDSLMQKKGLYAELFASQFE